MRLAQVKLWLSKTLLEFDCCDSGSKLPLSYGLETGPGNRLVPSEAGAAGKMGDRRQRVLWRGILEMGITGLLTGFTICLQITRDRKGKPRPESALDPRPERREVEKKSQKKKCVSGAMTVDLSSSPRTNT
jgi:hypothetical protein